MLQNTSLDDTKIKKNWLISFLLNAFLQMLLPTYAFIFFSCRSIFYTITNIQHLDITTIAFLTLMPAIYLLKWLLISVIYYFSYKKRGIIILSLSMVVVLYLAISMVSSTLSFPFNLKYHSINIALVIANLWYIIASIKFLVANRKLKLNIGKS